MEVIIKNWDELKFVSIPDNELELVRVNNEEVITDITLSQEDKIKLWKWCRLNSDMTITETELYSEVNNREGKEQKAIDISSIATLSDQLNLIMEILFIVVSYIAKSYPAILQETIVKEWFRLREWIKNILNK